MRTSVILGAALFLLSDQVFGQAGPAFHCVASAPRIPTVRLEGLAELVGDVLLSCTGGTPTPAGATVPAATISIALNAAVTSRLLANQQSEALLMLDDPTGRDQRGCIQPGGCATQAGAPGANMFTGVQTGSNSLTWLGVPLDPPGSGNSRQIRITNIRVNANQLGKAGLSVPAPIVGAVSLSANSLAAGVDNSQQTLANAQPGLTLGARPGSFQYCAGFNGNQPFTMNGGIAGPAQSWLVLSEGFPLAFKAPGSTLQNRPGQVYNSEGGFTPNGTAGLDAIIGRAELGTAFTAALTGVPQGVAIVVPRQIGLVDGSGVMAGAAVIAPGSGFLSGANIVFEPEANGTVTILLSIGSRDTSKAGLLTLSIPISFIGAPASVPVHVLATAGFATSPEVVSQSVATIVPCTGQGAGLSGPGTSRRP